MTTIVFRDGIMATDSQETYGDGTKALNCQKLFKKTVGGKPVVLAISGALYSARVFCDWYGSKKKMPEVLKEMDKEDEDFEIFIFQDGKLFIVNWMCRPIEHKGREFLAGGSGGKIALGALEMGASARQAVKAAIVHDCYSGGKIQWIRLKGN